MDFEEEDMHSALAGFGGGAALVEEDGNPEVFAALIDQPSLVDFKEAFKDAKADHKKQGMAAARKVLSSSWILFFFFI